MNICLGDTRHFCRKVGLFFIIFCLVAAVIVPSSVSGKMNMTSWVSPEDDEFTALPRWCQIRMTAHPRMRGRPGSENVPDSVMRENQKYAKIFGERVYNSAHHYCNGLSWIQRYKSSLFTNYEGVVDDRETALTYALKEFNYFEGHKTLKTSKLYIPIRMNEAYIYQELGALAKAGIKYKELMKTKPAYPLAYVEYAKLLNSVGKKSDAIKILKIGLQKTKGSKAIKQMIASMNK